MSRHFSLFATLLTAVFSASIALADDTLPPPSPAPNVTRGMVLMDQPSDSANYDSRKRSAASINRLRQERAAYRYQQQVARLEANAWLGYEPLRPGWSSVPMMSSRYPERRTIIVPVYVD